MTQQLETGWTRSLTAGGFQRQCFDETLDFFKQHRIKESESGVFEKREPTGLESFIRRSTPIFGRQSCYIRTRRKQFCQRFGDQSDAPGGDTGEIWCAGGDNRRSHGKSGCGDCGESGNSIAEEITEPGNNGNKGGERLNYHFCQMETINTV